MIEKFDEVPSKFTYPSGEHYKMFIRRKTGNKGYIVAIWEMAGEVQDKMIWYANGPTVREAKESLKKKILRSSTDKTK